MFVAALVLTCGLVGCGSIEDDYISVNEDAYRLIGDEHLALVDMVTAPKGVTAARVEALGKCSDECRARAQATTDPVERDAWTVRADALLQLAEVVGKALTPDQAQSRHDTILAWWSALEEGRKHRGKGATSDLPPLPPPRGSGVERAPPGDAVTTPEGGR